MINEMEKNLARGKLNAESGENTALRFQILGASGIDLVESGPSRECFLRSGLFILSSNRHRFRVK
jgi:hypothetical protein